MVLAFTVYTFLILTMVVFLFPHKELSIPKTSQYIIKRLKQWIPIIIISIVFGLRYGVGVDYFSYMYLYTSQSKYSIFDSDASEFIFAAINHICYKLSFPYPLVLIILNLISFSFLTKTFQHYNYKLLCWIYIFLFFTGQLFLHLNIQRQSISLFILIFSTRYITQQRFIPFFITLIIATGFHYSALLFLPIYFISKYRFMFLYNRCIQIIIWACSLLLSIPILNLLLDAIKYFMQFTNYARYGTLLTDLKMTEGSGVGFFVKNISDFITILYSVKMLKYYNSKQYNIFYFIYFIGIISSNVFGTSLLLSRIAFLFVSFRFIILGHLLYYLNKNKTLISITISFILISVYVCYFIGMILWKNNDCAPFQFV